MDTARATQGAADSLRGRLGGGRMNAVGAPFDELVARAVWMRSSCVGILAGARVALDRTQLDRCSRCAMKDGSCAMKDEVGQDHILAISAAGA